MRIRTIKPDFFKDEDLADLDPLVRILFIGLWCLADGEGRLEYRPKYIKVEVLPYNDCNIENMLDELMGKQPGSNREATGKKKKYVKKYEFEGREYLVITNFSKHQRITGKEAKTRSKFPPPPSTEKEAENERRETPGKQPGNTGERLDAQEGKGKERKEKKKREGNAANDAAPPVDLTLPVATEKEKPPHVDFVERFGATYEAMAHEPFKADAKHYAIAAKLFKSQGAGPVIKKAQTLGRLCETQGAWFTKRGWSDYTIEKLSSMWNEILEVVEPTREDKLRSAMKKQEEIDEQRRSYMAAK